MGYGRHRLSFKADDDAVLHAMMIIGGGAELSDDQGRQGVLVLQRVVGGAAIGYGHLGGLVHVRILYFRMDGQSIFPSFLR